MADAIYEHKKGKVWTIVAKQERTIRALRLQNRLLQARVRRLRIQRGDTDVG